MWLEITVFATLFFWVCGILAVAGRHWCPTFAQWSRYGGRVIGDLAATSNDRPKTLTKRSRRRWWCPWILALIFSVKCVSRKHAFCSFYIVGSSSVVVIQLLAYYGSTATNRHNMTHWDVPLLVFGVHCAVRLCETMFRQRFREKDDFVTPFSAFSASVFYLFAALSSSCVIHAGFEDRCSWSLSSTTIFVAVQLLLQMGQVYHHEVLRSMRSGSVNVSSSPKKKDEGERSGAVYHFPYGKFLFRIVQEPHYAIEIVMYGVSWAFLELYCHPCSSEGGAPSSLRRLLPVGVFLFTLLNLWTTTLEHREYWIASKAVAHHQFPRWKLIPLLL